MRVAPLLVESQQSRQGAFGKLGVGHVAVGLVLIRMRHLVGETPVPHKVVLVSGKVDRIVEEPVVGLILAGERGAHRACRQDGLGMENHNARHRVRAIEQAGRPFDHLYAAHAQSVNLDAVLVAPLLSLLADAVVDGHDAVVAQSANHGFRDAAAGGNLRYARLPGDGVDNVGGRGDLQLALAQNAHRNGEVFLLGIARQTGYYHFVQHMVMLTGDDGVHLCIRTVCRSQP